MLAIGLTNRSGVRLNATTVRRWLARSHYRYRRACPTTLRRHPWETERLGAIKATLADTDSHAEVFYVYEADVDLNPRIGPSSMRCAEKTTVPTPGENQNHCIAGAIHVRTGRLVWIEYHRKTPPIFAKPLECLRGQCRRVRPIVLIIDNYATHKNRLTHRWLAPNP